MELLYFFNEECDHCQHVDEFVLEILRETYPIRVVSVCIDSDEGYVHLLSIEKTIGDEGNEIPVIFIGNRALGGVEEIEDGLEQAIIDLISGKTAADERRSPPSHGKGRASEKVEQINEPDQKCSEKSRVYVAYFTQAGYKERKRAFRDVRHLSSHCTHIVIREFDIADPESKTLNEALGEICGVPEKKRFVAPSLYIGRDILVQDEIRIEAIERLVFFIFTTVYKGASSQQLTAFLQRSSACIKLSMSVFFFCPCFNSTSNMRIKMYYVTCEIIGTNSRYKFKV